MFKRSPTPKSICLRTDDVGIYHHGREGLPAMNTKKQRVQSPNGRSDGPGVYDFTKLQHGDDIARDADGDVLAGAVAAD